MRLLSIFSGNVLISTLSMRMLPLFKLETRRSALIIEDLPAPVRPTQPIRSYDEVCEELHKINFKKGIN